MSAESSRLAPEVEALLREVAADPRSTLLRVPRRALSAVDAHPSLSVATAGLSSAENELVRVWRREAAFALRQACWWLLAEGERSRSIVSRDGGSSGPIEVPRADEVAHQCGWLLAHPSRDQHASQQTELAACRTARPELWPSVVRLASAAYRLEPHVSARMYLGMALAQGERASASLEVLAGMRERGLTPDVRVALWTNRAFAQNTLGNLLGASKSLELAASADPECATTQVSRACLAVRRDDAEELRSTMEVLEQLVRVRPQEVERALDGTTARRQLGLWHSERSHVDMLRRENIMERELGRRLIDVFR